MSENEFILQMQPCFGAEEKQALCDYMDQGGFVTEYRQTALFEQRIAEYVGARHCVVVNNGTLSLSLTALACGLSSGDEVIVPNYTMIATPNSVKLFGIEPVFVDVEPESLCLNLQCVEAAISEKTKAIMLVSANGRYPLAGIEGFERLARERDLWLIEDAAQSLGSRYPDGRHMGTAGHLGSFSFSSPKIISTGQGGCVVTDDDALAAKLRKLKDFGRQQAGTDRHDMLGLNCKFTDIQACIGLAQMEKLPARVERKKAIYRRYRQQLEGLPQLQFFQQDLQCTTPWFIDVMVEQREELIAHLKAQKIGSRVMYPPINKQAAYSVAGEHPISNAVGDSGLWLPSASQLSDKEIDRICATIRQYYTP